jgi:hypothetical protein
MHTVSVRPPAFEERSRGPQRHLLDQGLEYAVGIFLYWLSLRFITASGVFSATVQTLTWFVITVIGVAVLSGDFEKWDVGSYVLAVVAVAAVAGLLVKA